MDPRSCWWHWSLQRELPARVPVFAFTLAFGYLSGDWHPGALARGTTMMMPRSFEFELGLCSVLQISGAGRRKF